MTTIERVTITPVAFRDPPLLNAVGVHEPFALRSIIQLHTNDGLVGLGESYGDGAHLERLRVVGESMTGLDPFHTHDCANSPCGSWAVKWAATPTG